MEKPSIISIIIPTYNRANPLKETLDSVTAQVYTNWECIVIDDGSTDSTKQIVHDYMNQDTRFQYHKRPLDRAKGGSAARNYGYELSTGEFIQWFDDDDIMLPNYLQSRIDRLNEKTQLALISGKLVTFDMKEIKSLSFDDSNSLYRQYVLKSSDIFTPSIMFRKDFLKGKQLFNEALKRSQEAELFSRLLFKVEKENYIQINESGFLYRQHESSKSTFDKTYNSEFKYAHFLVHKTNWDQAVLINDQEIINLCYRKIIALLVEIVRNKDRKLYKLILNDLKTKISRSLYLKIRIGLFILGQMKSKGYRIKSLLIRQHP